VRDVPDFYEVLSRAAARYNRLAVKTTKTKASFKSEADAISFGKT